MSLERAKAYLKEYKMEDQIREFPVSSATVELAAEALHTEAGRIAKTLSFLVDGEAVLIVCAGDARIDNAKYKHFSVRRRRCLRRMRWRNGSDMRSEASARLESRKACGCIWTRL